MKCGGASPGDQAHNRDGNKSFDLGTPLSAYLGQIKRRELRNQVALIEEALIAIDQRIHLCGDEQRNTGCQDQVHTQSQTRARLHSPIESVFCIWHIHHVQ